MSILNNTDYDKWILRGCPVDKSVETLYVIDCGVTSIKSEIENLTNLLHLYLLNNNNLIYLPSSIGNLHKLRTFICCGNKITTIPIEFFNISTLISLNISDNHIDTIPPEIALLKNLSILDICFNHLTTLPAEINTMTNLQELCVSHNNLTTLNICNLINLRILNVSSNRLTTIPAEIGNFHNLEELYIYSNPIVYIPPNVARRFYLQRNTNSLYQNTQSVHNSAIQQSIKTSIMRLISINPTLKSESVLSSIISDFALTDFTKQSLIEYSRCTDLISEVNVTFLEVLTAVWNRIITSEHSTDIKAVLNDEMADAECKCFTGRVSRLVNCLAGVDELVEVKIADNEQIGNVIAVIGDRLKAEGKYTVELHKETASIELKELGYTEEVVGKWLEYIE